MDSSLGHCTVEISGTLRDALVAIDSGQQVALVLQGGRLVGLLTDGDVRRALLAGIQLDAPLAPHVNRDFTSVAPGTPRDQVLDLMRASWFDQIPIVDAGGRLLGLHLLQQILGMRERENAAVIMAGGRGTRLWPLTEDTPKPMLSVAGRPILERLVLHLVGFGVRQIYLAVHHQADIIESHFGDGSQFGCKITYLREDQPLGTGGALSLLPETPTAPLLVLNGDLVTQFDVDRMLTEHEAGGTVATVGLRNYVYTVPFGVVSVSDSRVTDLREKPSTLWQVNAGIYVISPALLARVEEGRAFHMTELIQGCLRDGQPVGAFLVEEGWIDVGRPHQLAEARGNTNAEAAGEL